MIARLFVHLRPGIYIPEGEQYKPCDYDLQGCTVREYFPGKNKDADAEATADGLTINGVTAFYANVLQFDFFKPSFFREASGPVDPTDETLSKVINSYLTRLRHVTRAGLIRAIDFPRAKWLLTYLHDDESRLPDENGKIGGRGYGTKTVSWIAFNRGSWEAMHDLPADYLAPPWESLLIDASADLANVGPSVTLAAMALEIFIANLLDKLVRFKQAGPDLRDWLKTKPKSARKPSVSDQFDIILNEFIGHSLKEDQRIWSVFKRLRSARNSFVHEGVAKIDDVPVDLAIAQELVSGASNVIAKIREWTPKELHWPEHRHSLQVGVSMRIG